MSNHNIRKHVNRLTDEEKQNFINAVLALKENGRYDQYVQWHAEAGQIRTPSGSDRRANHVGSAFLPWHREFIYRFERDLQNVNNSVVLPYWDWTNEEPERSTLWENDFMGGDGNSDNENIVEAGPFAAGQWETIDGDGNPTGPLQRNFGGRSLPTWEDVQTAVNITRYDASPWDFSSRNSFRNYLEQLHNQVHVWVGGHMQSIPLSSNDPLFFLLHANVDRIWVIWQITHQAQSYRPVNGGPIGHNLNDSLFPWQTSPSDVLNHRSLGYLYDTEVHAVQRARKRRQN